MKPFHVISKNLTETERLVAEVFKDVVSTSRKNATILALSGDLGSGKTAFVKVLAKQLGITEIVSSPTFVIEKIYAVTALCPFEKIIHIDAYRLEHADELLKLGWQDIISSPKNLICIEWPEKVSGIIPHDALRIQFTFIDENTREMRLIQ